MADFPSDASLISELQTADIKKLNESSMLAIETTEGTKNINIATLIKLLSRVSQENYAENRNLWTDAMPIGALNLFWTREKNQGKPRNLGNWLPCYGQVLERVKYPILFEVMGIPSDATQIQIPNLNQGTNGYGYFMRGGDTAHIHSFVTVKDGKGKTTVKPQNDAIRNMKGDLAYMTDTGGNRVQTGVFRFSTRGGGSSNAGDHYRANYITFDASRVVPVSWENRPYNYQGIWYIKVDNKY